MKGGKWPVQEQARFLKRTGELLTRGYRLSEAIESLSFYLNKKRKEDIKKSLEQMREGYPFYLVLENLNFNRDLVSYVYFAEQHGGLAHAVIDGSEMVLKRESDLIRLKKLGSYPLFLVMLTGVLFFFVDHVLLPKFTSLFNEMNVTPNFFMQAISTAASVFPYLLYVFLMFSLLGVGYYFIRFNKLSSISQKVILTRIPIAGKLLSLLYTHFFAIQMSYLFSGGLSVREALKVFENNRHEPFSKELGRGIILKLAMGQDFDKAISAYPIFEDELSMIVRHGQINGKLDQELFFYSRHCLNQLEERTEKGMKIVQPILYSFIGLLVVSLYLAILLPMFQLIQGI